LKVKGKKGKRL
jgi:alpha-galactosidase/6-phospho-beta-glucosidase family protein